MAEKDRTANVTARINRIKFLMGRHKDNEPQMERLNDELEYREAQLKIMLFRNKSAGLKSTNSNEVT